MLTRKKFILAAVLLLITVVGVMIFIKHQNKPNDQATQQTANTNDHATESNLLGQAYTNEQAGVTMRLPKGWRLEPKNGDSTNVLTVFRKEQSAEGAKFAYGELAAQTREGTGSVMTDIVQSYTNAGIEIDPKNDFLDVKEAKLGNVADMLSREELDPNGQKIRATHYILVDNNTFYTLTFMVALSDWEAERPAIEASAKSVAFQ